MIKRVMPAGEPPHERDIQTGTKHSLSGMEPRMPQTRMALRCTEGGARFIRKRSAIGENLHHTRKEKYQLHARTSRERKRRRKLAFIRRCKEKRRLSRLPPITPIRFTSANDDIVMCTRSFPAGSFAFEYDSNVWGCGETSLEVEGELDFERRRDLLWWSQLETRGASQQHGGIQSSITGDASISSVVVDNVSCAHAACSEQP